MPDISKRLAPDTMDFDRATAPATALMFSQKASLRSPHENEEVYYAAV
jgi:hypothetical protein